MFNERLIVISSPDRITDEVSIWQALFEAGLYRLHVRKPTWNHEEIGLLLHAVPSKWRNRVVVHHWFDACGMYRLAGIHASYQNFDFLKFGQYLQESFSVSCSVHSWQELEQISKKCHYVFMGPIFDSISKMGYSQNHLLHSIPETFKESKIYALGGIDTSRLHQVLEMGYYGIGVLGYIWEQPSNAVHRFVHLLDLIQQIKTV